jgi:hypothetical protein
MTAPLDDQFRLADQVHQYDRNPGRGESTLHALAFPPATAVAAVTSSEAKAIATGDTRHLNVAPDPLAHRDAIRDQNDSASRLH